MPGDAHVEVDNNVPITVVGHVLKKGPNFEYTANIVLDLQQHPDVCSVCCILLEMQTCVFPKPR